MSKKSRPQKPLKERVYAALEKMSARQDLSERDGSFNSSQIATGVQMLYLQSSLHPDIHVHVQTWLAERLNQNMESASL